VTLTPHPLLVPWSGKGRAIPLLPLWALRPVQSLSACTRVTFTFTFLTQEADLEINAEKKMHMFVPHEEYEEWQHNTRQLIDRLKCS